MKRTVSFLVLTLFALNLIAQNDKSKKVESKFLQLPMYDISKTEPSTVKAVFAAGDASFGEPAMKDVKATCVPKGGSLKDAIEISTYYYQIPLTIPASYVIGKDAVGNIVYAEQISKGEESAAKFGFKECSYWIAETMKKDYEKEGAKFRQAKLKETENDLLQQAEQVAKANIYPSYVMEEFQVYSAKGKSFDYSELDIAQETAMAAYEMMYKNGPDQASFDKLISAITVWEKELQELNEEDKKSRINKSIGKGLYENLARAYMYTYQMDEAIKAGKAGKKLYGNFSNNRSAALDAEINRMRGLKIAIENNAAITQDMGKLKTIAMQTGTAEVSISNVGKAQLANLASDYNSFVSSNAMAVHEAEKKMYDEAVASGEVNPYEKYITETATQGKMIMMTPFTLAPELTEFPKEMCAIEDLSQVTIQGNKITSIPAEISNLKQLTKLSLTGNQITSLPSEIGDLTSLKTLNLSNNPITEIPDDIQKCTSLKSLNLKGTKLSSEQQQKLISLLPKTKIKF